MSVRETPKSNRYLDLKEKERAYRKHMEAVANARPTIDTSTPDCPNRLRVKEKADAHYRRHLLTDYSKRERMIASAKSGKRPNQEIFPDDYNPDDDDDIDFDELVKKYGGDGKKESDANAIIINNQPEKTTHKTEKIHFGYDKDHEVQIEEEDADDVAKSLDEILNDRVDDLTKKNKNQNKPKNQKAASKIPISKKTPTSSKSTRSSKDEDNSSKKKIANKDNKTPKKEDMPKEPITDSKEGLLNSSLDEKKLSSSVKKNTMGNTASSAMSFGDDFEDDFENDQTDEGKDNFDETESESTENKFEEEKSESNHSDNDESNSDSDSEERKKVPALAERDSDEENLDKTDPMTNPLAKLAEDKNSDDKNSDDIPDLDFPDF
ncbi:hypothetical protein M9Y10_023988 [Tritrichomonas musculus]|uniref:Uncharacterized protein n=1 Tax=Tritrichomonas musculus TaxID=1915356 RepID=A0ABR2KXI8_9EUKA